MDNIDQLIDLVLHLDEHLDAIFRQHGWLAYGIVFAIVFCETGLVVTPFLPGDSLLFALGALGANGTLSLGSVFVILSAAAILGDAVNYWAGSIIGPKAFTGRHRFLKREYLERAHRFYQRHGGKAIILARFVPIIRTFAPFVAGVGAMSYPRFFAYNVVGGVGWVAIGLAAGYWFGNIPLVKHNFTLVIVAIVLISMVPLLIEVVRQRRRAAS